MMMKLIQFHEKFIQAQAKLTSWLVVLLMLIIVLDIFIRLFFVAGSIKFQEMAWHLHGSFFLLSLAWAYQKNRHVRIELFSAQAHLKTQIIVEICGLLFLIIPFIMALIYFSFDYAFLSLAYMENSASPSGLPYRFIIKFIMVYAFLLLLTTAFSRLFKLILFLFKPMLFENNHDPFLTQKEQSHLS